MPSARPQISIVTLLSVIGFIAIVLAAWRAGYLSGSQHSGSRDLVNARVISLDELDSISSDRALHYQGSNDQFHYIRVDGAGYYRLTRADVSIPLHGFEGDGTSALGMTSMTLTIEDNRLKASSLPTGSF